MITPKSLTVVSINHFDAMSIKNVALEMAQMPHHSIECVNWPAVSDYRPEANFAIAHSEKYIYVHFNVNGEDLRAVNTANLSPVADDSCVEFFLQVPGSPEYWNFEFNCIGAVNASHREHRPDAVRLNDEQIALIKRYASCGNEAFEEISGQHEWSLTIAIPFSLISDCKPDYIMGNFYKCAGQTSHPHYLSWSRIDTEKPNFHVPQYFGKLILL